ncbi:hypothetical protein GCM10023196_024720 [Actinoallomurus vinaceus]|uniref:Lectin-like protein BA14k n=1 Tax=Actinoallomurus vinaceus TaxID=1080074 RepID=A0ABP8U5L6_9ACTN
MKVPMGLVVSGLVFAGGITLAATPANAATGQGKVTASAQGAAHEATVAANRDSRPRCRKYVRGHWVHTRRGRVFMAGYWLPRGCVHRR